MKVLDAKSVCLWTAVGLVSVATAAGSRDDFLKQQAYAEMQRVTSQIDVIQNNQDDLARRVSKLEKGDSSKAEVESLRAEVANLRALVAELKKQMDAQRGQIVADLSQRIAKAQQAAPAPTPKKAKPSVPCKEYTVQSGDTLSLIAEAFGTTVSKIQELNPNVKANSLRVGQKINVPAK